MIKQLYFPRVYDPDPVVVVKLLHPIDNIVAPLSLHVNSTL